MGAAHEAPPVLDRILFALVYLAVSVARVVSGARNRLAKMWIGRSLGTILGSHDAKPKVLDDPSRRLPPHIAFAGALQSTDQVNRLARAARDAGASVVSVHQCGCHCIGLPSSGTHDLCDDSRSASSDGSQKCGGFGDSCSFCNSSRDPSCSDRRKASSDSPLWSATTGPDHSASLIKAARWLAATPLAKRGVDVTDSYALIDWLDRDSCGVMLPSEPDVLIIFVGSEGLRTIHGFPPWQLRLTQICFVYQRIECFDVADMLDTACQAAAAPKRFGT